MTVAAMMVVWTLFLLALVHQSECQCTFPANLSGTWTTGGQGTWIINSTHIQDFITTSDSGRNFGDYLETTIDRLTFECHENRGDTVYVLKSSETIEYAVGVFVYVYTCIAFEEISTTKYLFYRATALDGNGDQYSIPNAYETVCSNLNYKQPYSYRLALKSGTETSALIQCPSSVFGSYTYDTCTNTTSATSMNGCGSDTRDQLVHNYTLCSTKQMFSLEGTLDCVYFESSGSTTYLTVYNRDNTVPNGVDTFRFSCMAVTKSGSEVKMTVYPNRCLDNQNSTAIASPGYPVTYTSYYLCPLTTPSEESESGTDILPIIIGIIAALLIIAAIILIICCCCCCRKKKSQEDVESLKEDDDDDDNNSEQLGRSRRGSHAFSRRESQEGSKSSLDSGIEEPTRRSGDGKFGGGEGEPDQLSRMSDLPPSTIPPDEDGNVHEDQKEDDDVKSTLTERDEGGGQTVENEDNPPPQDQEEDDVNPDETDEQKQDQDSTKSDDEGETKEEEADDKLDTGDEQQDTEEEDNEEEEDGQKKKDGGNDSDGSDDENGPDGRGRRRRRRGRNGELGSDGEGSDLHSSDSEYQRQRELNRIGRKGGRHYQPSGALTTVLVSREDDEKKRSKLSKTKKQKTKKMNKMARLRTRKLGDKGGKLHEDGLNSSDDEMRFVGEGNAAFMEQYRQKKRLEHILDEQHYWSDPEDDKDNLGRRLSGASSLSSSDNDEDDYEIIIDENGVARRVRKPKGGDGADGADGDEYETIIGADGVARRVKKTDGSYETIVGADGIEIQVKKTDGNGESTDISDEHAKKKLKSGDQLTNVEDPDNAGDLNDKDDQNKLAQKYSERDKNGDSKLGANAKLINVKGRPDEGEEGLTGKRRGKGGKLYGPDADGISDFNDTDMDKISDVDSGLSEDDEPVDVILTPDQQQLIVNMLFDEDMNLRPQFDRDEDGRIVRRLDGSVIYDPHTGRFTFQRRLGQLFKIPRLKRNDKGRPTGGYIQDDYGPKVVPNVKGDSGKRGRIGSGKSSGDPSSTSPSADQKRSKTMDGKNVGFNIPDDEMESMNIDQLENNKRGRRDISSAIRRSLNRRLFRKKRKRGNQDVSPLPDVRLNKSWTGESLPFAPGAGDMRGGPHPGMSPALSRSDRTGSFMGTPGQQRRSMGANDIEQLQKNREGLEHDRKILEKHNRPPWETRQAFVNSDGEGDFDDETGDRQDQQQTEHDHGLCYRNPDGRLAIREKGCPDLKHHHQNDQFFTVVRRRRDLENAEIVREMESLRKRNIHTAPVTSQSSLNRTLAPGQVNKSDESIDSRPSDGGRMSSIDDNRLRRLLEELYKDKKYFDAYIDATEPKSVAIAHSQGLAEHGRGYLLERADYWEKRGPLPPRPPQTAVGWRMQRQQTMWASRESQMNRTSTTMTLSPTQESIPGMIDSPREAILEQDENQHDNDSIKIDNESINITDDTDLQRELKESEA